MRKPKRLRPGDTVAVVSLSSGIMGDPPLIHKYEIARARLERDFGLRVRPMPHALKGSEFVYAHPELRARDLMDAFADDTVDAVFCAIGGDDSVRLLPYVDIAVLRAHPKIFMGYSDTTVTHFMLQKAGIVSFYGPSVMAEFGEYVRMFPYTRAAVERVLFSDCAGLEIPSAPQWSADHIPWDEKNVSHEKELLPETHGYETLQGGGVVSAPLIGGCVDVFPMLAGTSVWPTAGQWRGKLLLLETSEEEPAPSLLTYYLRNLGAQGVFDAVRGILVGKPHREACYEAYRDVYKKVTAEFGRSDLPVLYNVNAGHAQPIGVWPLGSRVRVDFSAGRITLAESPTAAPAEEV